MTGPIWEVTVVDRVAIKVLRCVSAAEQQTAEQYSKTGKTKPRKHLPRSNLSWTLARTSSRY